MLLHYPIMPQLSGGASYKNVGGQGQEVRKCFEPHPIKFFYVFLFFLSCFSRILIF